MPKGPPPVRCRLEAGADHVAVHLLTADGVDLVGGLTALAEEFVDAGNSG
jgi:hypothetical protein